MAKFENGSSDNPKIQRYLRIMRLIRSGNIEQLNKNDYKFYSQFTFDVDQNSINKLKDETEFKNMSDEEIDSALRNSFLQAVQQPETRDAILSSAQDLEQSAAKTKITDALNVALAGTDIATSLNQINQSGRARRQIRRPGRPAPLTEEPLLKGALADASRGNLDAAKAMSPAQLQILDQYLSDMNTAKTVSGGQAGIYGSLAQEASTRRGRSAGQLVPLYDGVRRESEQRYDQLLQQKLSQNQNIQQSQAQYYPYDLQQYNADTQAAGNLGLVGRENLRSSVGALAGFLPQAAARLQTRKRFRDLYNQGLVYGHDNAKIMAEADYNHQNGYNDYNDPRYQNQLEQIYGTYS
jgi:hypothetical protein